MAGAAGTAFSGASNAISGALSPTHRGRGSESMLGGQVGVLNCIYLPKACSC